MRMGYARVSGADQNLEVQLLELKAAGCEVVRSEKVSGTSMEGRDELTTLLQFARAGDEIVVVAIDRLARSIKDLSIIVDDLTKRGVSIRATRQAIDTSTPAGRMFLNMLGVFAEFETSIRRERQMAGIAKAKARGEYSGRGGRPAAVVDLAKARALAAEVGPTKAAKAMGVGRSTLFRAVKGAA